jgi:uncharacterized damage-inducible protein DinB
MPSPLELTRHSLDRAYLTAAAQLTGITLEDALFIPVGGYRSVLGILKHMAAWSHVYQSYAFDAEPKRWEEIAWPRGLRDRVEPTRDYLDDVIAWFAQSHDAWMVSLTAVDDGAVDRRYPLHWGQTATLFEIVAMVANHHVYHAGEINFALALQRGEAWEEGEEVEENHIDTVGHRVRPSWRS